MYIYIYPYAPVCTGLSGTNHVDKWAWILEPMWCIIVSPLAKHFTTNVRWMDSNPAPCFPIFTSRLTYEDTQSEK